MASENPYLAGNPVYGGGSSMPTAGTVDPMGYIGRGINQQSQKRSGLAAAALSKLNAPQDPATVAPTAPLGRTIDFTISPTGQLIPADPPAPVAAPSMESIAQQPPTSGAPDVSGLPPQMVSMLAQAAKARINGGQ